MKTITNLDEVKRKLFDMIFELEMDERSYQTDIVVAAMPQDGDANG